MAPARPAKPVDKQPPWKRKPKKKRAKLVLTAESKRWARARAKAAGRTYPNLVDNMAAARRQRSDQ